MVGFVLSTKNGVFAAEQIPHENLSVGLTVAPQSFS